MPTNQNHLVVAISVPTEIYSAVVTLVTTTFYFVSPKSGFKSTSLEQQATIIKFHALFLLKHSLQGKTKQNKNTGDVNLLEYF